MPSAIYLHCRGHGTNEPAGGLLQGYTILLAGLPKVPNPQVLFQPFRDLLLHNPANDHYALASGEPVFDERGGFCGYHGLSRDVTAEKRAERAVQKSEAKFRALATMSSDWFWEQDENLR